MFKYATNTILNDVDRITADSTNHVLKIAYLGNFKKDDVVKIYKREYNAGTKCQVTITPVAGPDSSFVGDWRLKTYVKLVGSNNANFANDMVFKGKPFVFDFKVGTNSAAGVVTAAKKAIDYVATRFGERIFDYTNATGTLVISPSANSGATEDDVFYMEITEAILQKIGPAVTTNFVGETETILSDSGDPTSVVHAVSPFGTYFQLIKDSRLPTPENTGFTSLTSGKNEMPVLGQKYTQYIIYMCKNRGIMGGDAVGVPVKSVTAHSIWVPTTYVPATTDGNGDTVAAHYEDALGTAIITAGVVTSASDIIAYDNKGDIEGDIA